MGPEPDMGRERAWLYATAWAGLAGAAVMFAGDMLLYGHFGAGGEFGERHIQEIASASTARLFVAGALGPLAVLGYLPGVAHIHARLCRAPRALRWATSLLLTSLVVLAGAVHAVWGAYALAVRSAATDPGAEAARSIIGEYLSTLYRMAEVAGYPAAILLLVLVLASWTTYPRWSAIVNPGLLNLASALAVHVPAPVGAVLVGGSFNLSFGAFFIVSLATVRGTGLEERDRGAS